MIFSWKTLLLGAVGAAVVYPMLKKRGIRQHNANGGSHLDSFDKPPQSDTWAGDQSRR